ncbi:MAG: hypothetical protein DSY89_02105, partial [Deltaproteobacteria bacterium]
GLIQLQRIRKDLDSTCRELFKPGGSKPAINRTLSQIKETIRAQKTVLLSVRTWQTHDRALVSARKEVERIHRALTDLKQENGKLERMTRALPLIVRLQEVETELSALKDVPQLPDHFGEQRQQAMNNLKIAQNDLTRIKDTIGHLENQAEAIEVRNEVIAHSELIETLQHDLGSYRKAQKDRPGLVAEMKALARQVSEKRAEIESDDFSLKNTALNLSPSTAGDIQELHTAFDQLAARQESAEDRLQKLKARIQSLETQKQMRPTPMDVGPLKAAIQAAQGAGPVEEQYSARLLAINTREAALASDLKRFSLLAGSPETIDSARYPSTESIAHFETAFSEIKHRIEKHRDERRNLIQEISRVQADLEAIRLSQNVPMEADLDRARSVRKSGWDLVRATLEGHAPPSEAIQAFIDRVGRRATLPDAFEKSIEQADDVADRLRREAGQVSRKSVLESRRHQLESMLETAEKELNAAQAEQAKVETEWRQRWKVPGIDPLSPREMRQWLSDILDIQTKTDDIRADRLKADTMAAGIQSIRKQITQALSGIENPPDMDAPLSVLIGFGHDYLSSQAALQSDREKIAAELTACRQEKADIEADLASLKSKRARWEDRWAKNMSLIGVPATVRPPAAARIIDNIRQFRTLEEKADLLRKRVEGIDRDAHFFQHQVRQLVDTLAPALSRERPERATVLLNSHLTAAREHRSALKSIETQLAAANAARQNAEKRVSDTQTLLDSLCRQARCHDPDELEPIERRALRRRQLCAEQEGIETQLRKLSAGAALDLFIKETEAIQADRIAPEMERISDEIDQLEKKRLALHQAIGTEEAELKRMDGSARAAELAGEKERLLAALEADVEHYARSKLAAVILSQTIEQYREKHQGPLIRRASELFARLTAGAFRGIRAEYDTKDNPVMIGIRTDQGKPVPVTGMSDGTVDQLYLALRLASLEQYLTSHEPLPFIVDDILLRFDDDRAAATLTILAELSRQTQVIFFTHHAHLVQLAEKHMPPGTIKQHVMI